MTVYWCERAWLGPRDLASGVTIEVTGSHISAVARDAPASKAIRLAGLTIPGFANCHSHAFHRALRGRTQRDRGTFWTWRETMYDVAEWLEPDSYYDLAYATYREMALAGIAAVGEFHYLHHDRHGKAYSDPNEMGRAVIAAARDAGLRITLLDTCYLSAGFGRPPVGVQVRFSDGTAVGWAERALSLDARGDAGVVIGAAIHSVRAVPAEQIPTVADAMPERPLHVHLSEQVAENEACLEHHGRTPTQLLADVGAVGSRLTAVHATHLTDEDVVILGRERAYADLCPTTERDLADGVGPGRALAAAGARLTLGSDSHAVIDPFEEMRAVELDDRLASQQRGHWRAADLLTAATATGHESLGFPDAGRIAVGAWADLVTIDTRTVRTAGSGAAEETVVFAAAPADITHLVASGQQITLDRAAVGRDLDQAINRVVTEL